MLSCTSSPPPSVIQLHQLFNSLEFLSGGRCRGNVLQDREQSGERVKEALVPEGGEQAAARSGCEGLDYLLAARARPQSSPPLRTTCVAAAPPARSTKTPEREKKVNEKTTKTNDILTHAGPTSRHISSVR